MRTIGRLLLAHTAASYVVYLAIVVWFKAYSGGHPHDLICLGVMAPLIALWVATFWVASLFDSLPGPPIGTAQVVFVWIYAAAFLVTFNFRHIRLPRRPPPPTGSCPVCRYDLTGNVSGVCPECGLQFKLSPPQKWDAPR